MVKTRIAGIEVQRWLTGYSVDYLPVTGTNSFTSVNGENISNKIGDEVTLDLTLEEVPTDISMAVAAALEAETVVVDYTTPVPKRDNFYKVSYKAECEDADPENPDLDDTENITWNLRITLRSAGLVSQSGSL